jgi:hypothetical protein
VFSLVVYKISLDNLGFVVMDEFEENIQRTKEAIRCAKFLRAQSKLNIADAKRAVRESKAKTGKKSKSRRNSR